MSVRHKPLFNISIQFLQQTCRSHNLHVKAYFIVRTSTNCSANSVNLVFVDNFDGFKNYEYFRMKIKKIFAII